MILALEERDGGQSCGESAAAFVLSYIYVSCKMDGLLVQTVIKCIVFLDKIGVFCVQPCLIQSRGRCCNDSGACDCKDEVTA